MTKEKTSDKESTKKCFVIMPFGGYFDEYYENIYIPAIKAAGMKPTRADDIYMPSSIVSDIWKNTQEANVILADLTGKNPNVFYELGLCHAITKPAVLITSSMDDVPFDLKSLRVIVYDKNRHDWAEKLKENITKYLKETINKPEDAIPPTFLGTSKKERLKVTPEQKELLSIRNEFEAFKREVRSTQSSGTWISGSSGVSSGSWGIGSSGITIGGGATIDPSLGAIVTSSFDPSLISSSRPSKNELIEEIKKLKASKKTASDVKKYLYGKYDLSNSYISRLVNIIYRV